MNSQWARVVSFKGSSQSIQIVFYCSTPIRGRISGRRILVMEAAELSVICQSMHDNISLWIAIHLLCCMSGQMRHQRQVEDTRVAPIISLQGPSLGGAPPSDQNLRSTVRVTNWVRSARLTCRVEIWRYAICDMRYLMWDSHPFWKKEGVSIPQPTLKKNTIRIVSKWLRQIYIVATPK